MQMNDDQKEIFLSRFRSPELAMLAKYLEDIAQASPHVENGEGLSWDAVKEKLKAIIENENKHEPLNDDEIRSEEQREGNEIARRTVAKYRKILNIAPARQRREF